MQYNKSGYNVITSLSAAGADISFAGNMFSIKGAPKFNPTLVQSTSGVVVTVAEVSQVDTLTPTSANSTIFAVQLIQTLANGVVLNQTFSYTSDASSSATEICNAFRTLINASNFAITASGTTTLILTADAGTPVFTSNVSMSEGTIAIALTTPGVYAVNTYASITAQAGIDAADFTVGATYTSFSYVFGEINGSVDKLSDSSVNEWTVYVQDGITNLAAFVAKLKLLNGVVTNNPLNLQLRDSGLSAAINSSATATAAQVSTGYITSTSGAAVTLTLPTGTDLGAQLGASAGYQFDLVVDNTAGSNTVTLAVGTNCIQSAWSVYQDVGGATLDVVSGVTGTAVFRFVFSSATACTFCRIA